METGCLKLRRGAQLCFSDNHFWKFLRFDAFFQHLVLVFCQALNFESRSDFRMEVLKLGEPINCMYGAYLKLKTPMFMLRG